MLTSFGVGRDENSTPCEKEAESTRLERWVEGEMDEDEVKPWVIKQ